MAQALPGGRLTKGLQELEDDLEEARFELVELREVVGHMRALHQGFIANTVEARRDVDAAEKRLEIAKRRLDIAERNEEESGARLSVVTDQIEGLLAANDRAHERNGFGHHLAARAKAADTADGALLALAKRRAQA